METSKVKSRGVANYLYKSMAPPNLQDYLEEQEAKKALKKQIEKQHEGEVKISGDYVDVTKIITLDTLIRLLKLHIRESLEDKCEGEDIPIKLLTDKILKKAVVKTLVVITKSLALGYWVHLHNFGIFKRVVKRPVDRLLNDGEKLVKKIIPAHFVLKFQTSNYIRKMLVSEELGNSPQTNILLRSSHDEYLETKARLNQLASVGSYKSTKEQSIQELESRFIGLSHLEKTMRKYEIGDILLDRFDLDVDVSLEDIKLKYLNDRQNELLSAYWIDILDFPLYYLT
jgi:nucleoid DNA-binding protein